MAEVYFYIPAEEAEIAVECGLKLSQWFDREINIEGEMKKCISGFINPKDDIEKYKSKDLKCLKLELPPRYCYVADKCLYQVGLNNPYIMEAFQQSIIPLEDYMFGYYRLPECIVTSTVIPGQVSILDMRRDTPILFSSSEDLYINNTIEIYKETHEDFNDAMLYSFYCKLHQEGKLEKFEDDLNKTAVFLDRSSGKTFITKVPDFFNY